ncbi:hypothetical protein EMPS_00211 [Entomortierella parvispora]|uniref:Uncharacterized protein n=1 Tax=Entomortierella parvispora TaxID=205924 RepID=A0A9P3H019_9FUNG|nr:hypothetical protein EMPS_00211 [Entomortierella parvispora]
MLQHVYPPWHKPVQRALFVVAAVLCITLPVLYGRHRSVSSGVLGAVLGLYFGCWLLFSLMVRFLIPSPRTESTLPVYNPSPIPTPVVFYSPNRSDALPASPAIRLPSAAALVDEKQPQRGARFASEIEDFDDDDDSSTQGARHQQHNSNNVTFQTRPRGNTTDSLEYPTFAAYRQAQHVNFDAFAQRVKKAFALKQDQERKEREEEKLALQQLQLQEEQVAAAAAAAAAAALSTASLQPQHRLLRPGNSRSQSSSMVPAASNNGKSSGTRSRSSSAAGMIGDFAERIKSGSSLFFRRSSSSFGIVTSNDSGAASGGGDSSTAKTASATTLTPVDHPVTVTGYHDAPESSAHNGAAPTTQTTTVEHRQTLMSSPPSGIEIRVTRSSLSVDDHP